MAMSALMARLAEENNSRTQQTWKENEVRVLKRNPLLNTSHLEILSDQLAKLLTQLRINEGVNLFVENKFEPHPQGLSVGDSE